MKNFLKRAISVILVLVMVMCMENVNFASAATTPTKQRWLSTMEVGNTATFTINNAKGYTFTWGSSKTTVATVGKKTGLVTALKAGTAKITATLVKGKSKVTLSGNVKVKAAPNTVSTQFGNVKGIQIGKIVRWYSIPYAAEPVGKLRWSNPQSPTRWTSTLDCTKSNSQTTLSLDVCASNTTRSNLPVFVFFHGGNNQSGSSGDLTGAEMVINEDCIVVSVNYRLGLLGFNCLPALQTEADSTGNYGFLDMQKSLQWVKDNIQKFGGDPNNVTVSGHSAGGRDVMAMLISPIFKGLFQKAIVSSGGMTTSDVDKSASQIASFLAPLAVKDGKASTEKKAKAWLLTSGKDVKEYLYSIPSEKLKAAVGDAAIRMSAFPHLYADGVTIPMEGFNTTAYNDVPVIMMTGTDEFTTFNSGTAYSDGSISKDELTAAKEFGRKYGSQMYGYFNACASAQSMFANGYQSSIYLMNVNFGHDNTIWPDISIGSYHGVTMSFLEKKSIYFPTPYATNGALQLGLLTNGYIKDFLWSSTGNPNSSARTSWTGYTATSSNWLVLDATRDAASSTMKAIDITSYEPIFAAMDSDKTISASAKSAVIKTVLNGRWFSSALDSKYGNANLWK